MIVTFMLPNGMRIVAGTETEPVMGQSIDYEGEHYRIHRFSWELQREDIVGLNKPTDCFFAQYIAHLVKDTFGDE